MLIFHFKYVLLQETETTSFGFFFWRRSDCQRIVFFFPSVSPFLDTTYFSLADVFFYFLVISIPYLLVAVFQVLSFLKEGIQNLRRKVEICHS